MRRPTIALAALALLATTSATPAAVFECSTALEVTRDAMNAIALKALGIRDKAQRCNFGQALLPLGERQVAIVEICEADHAKISAVRRSVSQTRENYQQDCGG
jgi:hypothetical protein